MSARGQTKGKVLLKILGAAALLGTKRAFSRGTGELSVRRIQVDTDRSHADDDTHSRRRDLITYGVGYVLALALTCCAFALVHWHWASGEMALGVVHALALTQVIVHFRCFLHVGLKHSARDDLQLILFSTLIIGLMVGGTLVVLFNLRMRMM